ncbi:hypothetical protein HK102_007457 [Quaeritorhiza haematococci]|nr:hypothetical protein HK102_007457 [Quaeritorhiza haematococci]
MVAKSTTFIAATAAAAALLAFTPGANAQLNCAGEAKTSCPSSAPCCSEFGVCGTSPQHCGGGCQIPYSFGPTSGVEAPCYAQRPAPQGNRCISGKYDFRPETTWMQNSAAYNGDPTTADFTVDFPDNVLFGSNGGLQLILTEPPNVSAPQAQRNPGQGARISTTSYLPYGTLRVRLMAGEPKGMVTSFITMADDKDEIDWEWTNDLTKAQTNVFYKGVIDYTKGVSYDTPRGNAARNLHDYEITWTADVINFKIDGVSVRNYTRAENPNTFPTSPSRVQFAVWDGGAASAGTRDWAGGYIDWTGAQSFPAPGGGSVRGYGATFMEVTIICPGDPEPTGPPARPSGGKAPSVSDAPINVAVASVRGFQGQGGVPTVSSAAGVTNTGSAAGPGGNVSGGSNSGGGNGTSTRGNGNVAGSQSGKNPTGGAAGVKSNSGAAVLFVSIVLACLVSSIF